MTKTLPILFNTKMVRAVLECRKTQTRRLLKTQPTDGNIKGIKPKYNVGDILYVRETWKPGAWQWIQRVAIDYKASPELTNTPWIRLSDIDFNKYLQRWADELEAKKIYSDVDGIYRWDAGSSKFNWRPSIHMPKWAARIFLKVVDIRIERIQDMTAQDFIAEGCGEFDDMAGSMKSPDGRYINHKKGFINTWNSIYQKQDYGWDKNPWVFVYEFEKLEDNNNNG